MTEEKRKGDKHLWIGIGVTVAIAVSGWLIQYGKLNASVEVGTTVNAAQWGQISKIDGLSDRVARLEGQIENCRR